MPLLFIGVLVLQGSLGNFINLMAAGYIMLIASLLLFNHALKIF